MTTYAQAQFETIMADLQAKAKPIEPKWKIVVKLICNGVVAYATAFFTAATLMQLLAGVMNATAAMILASLGGAVLGFIAGYGLYLILDQVF